MEHGAVLDNDILDSGVMTDLGNDLEVMAATIYGEARGEGLLGQRAVAAVIVNRTLSARTTPREQFGDGTFRSACIAPYQFSCWLPNDPNYGLLKTLNFAAPNAILAQCAEVAQLAISGGLLDPTNGALFYKVSSLPWPHDWGTEEAPCAVIGHHSFYRLS